MAMVFKCLSITYNKKYVLFSNQVYIHKHTSSSNKTDTKCQGTVHTLSSNDIYSALFGSIGCNFVCNCQTLN